MRDLVTESQQGNLKIRGGNVAQVYEVYEEYITGAYLSKNGWIPIRWQPNGLISSGITTNLDLILDEEPEKAA